MKTLFILPAIIGAAAFAGETGWRSVLKDELAKDQVPGISISSVSTAAKIVEIRITNTGSVPFKYSGHSATSPHLLWEREEGDRWIDEGWMWCGTGIETYTLESATSVTLKFEVRPNRRYFTFIDSVDGKRSSLILLYEPQKKNEPNKAMETTPVDVTIPATQEVAPSTFVSHL